jgi:hypothetical protein
VEIKLEKKIFRFLLWGKNKSHLGDHDDVTNTASE